MLWKPTCKHTGRYVCVGTWCVAARCSGSHAHKCTCSSLCMHITQYIPHHFTYFIIPPQDALWIIMVTSANALAYNVVHYLTIQITSAVTTTVLGMVCVGNLAWWCNWLGECCIIHLLPCHTLIFLVHQCASHPNLPCTPVCLTPQFAFFLNLPHAPICPIPQLFSFPNLLHSPPGHNMYSHPPTSHSPTTHPPLNHTGKDCRPAGPQWLHLTRREIIHPTPRPGLHGHPAGLLHVLPHPPPGSTTQCQAGCCSR